MTNENFREILSELHQIKMKHEHTVSNQNDSINNLRGNIERLQNRAREQESRLQGQDFAMRGFAEWFALTILAGAAVAVIVVVMLAYIISDVVYPGWVRSFLNLTKAR